MCRARKPRAAMGEWMNIRHKPAIKNNVSPDLDLPNNNFKGRDALALLLFDLSFLGWP